MSANRITPAVPPYDTSIADSFSRVMPAGQEPLKLFRTMARNPRILQRMFAGGLLDKGSVTLREREIMILRTCARCGSEYEWGVHVTVFSGKAGLRPDEIAATCAMPATGAWTDRERCLIDLADELHDTAQVSDDAWNRLMRHYTDEQAIELIALAGYYHTISFMTNALHIERESNTPRFGDALQ